MRIGSFLADMIEQSNSLLLNEAALKLCADPKKPVFIYEWLRYLDRILPAAQKVPFICSKSSEVLTETLLI